jgi:hypothetical protein
MSRKSSTKVTLNAKISSVNLQSIPFDGSSAIPEGAPIRRNSDGVAELATNALGVIYVNFVDSSRADVLSEQGDPFQDSLVARNTEGGMLTGIRGDGVDIGLPAECWDGGVLPAVGDQVTPTSGKFRATAPGSVIAGARYVGIVERVVNGKAHFAFYSTASCFVKAPPAPPLP